MSLKAENEEELKRFLMRMKEENEKSGLKLNIQKMKLMASGPIISQKIDGGKSEIKGCLLLGRKAMTNLDSILKSRHHFADKGPSSQSYGFSNFFTSCMDVKAEH